MGRIRASQCEMQSRSPRVLIISSEVVDGFVGGRGSLFVLQYLGINPAFLPTVTLPWHPGRGPGTRITAPSQLFCDLARDLAYCPFGGQFDIVLTGYFATVGQVKAVAGLVDAIGKANPSMRYICDPVLGDHGRLYVPENVARAQITELVPRADIITPNLFELGAMNGAPLDHESLAIAAAHSLPPRCVMVTSAPAFRAGMMTSLWVEEGKPSLALDHPLLPYAPKGTGDLASALLAGHLLRGLRDDDAFRRAISVTHRLVRRAAKNRNAELPLISGRTLLTGTGKLPVLRRLDTPGRRQKGNMPKKDGERQSRATNVPE